VSAADAGDDFSNNLLSDLAPILALFGEQVAKQYMSQSMGWVEDIIFAMAPLGIITAITGAIRVGGSAEMKAVIGRAREGKGVVEVELMSSTSDDVCELWNGDSVVRVLGSSPIIELYYLEYTPPRSPNQLYHNISRLPDQGAPLHGNDAWNSDSTKIYDFKSAKDARILETMHPNQLNDEQDDKIAPNIALNISSQRVSDLEFKVVAVVGSLLQLGVIVFAGLSVLSSPWNENFKKDGKLVRPYAFPSMAAGTAALVLGMFLCAYIIERSTIEAAWVINPSDEAQVRVAWVQKGGVVNDQQFDSYVIQRSDGSSKLWTNVWTKVSATFPTLFLALQQHLSIDTRHLIMTSRKHKNQQQASLTAVAICISLGGFIVQFIGLRGLNWSITIAQLLAIVIMSVLRAVVRRNLVHNVQPKRMENGYELDNVARQIKGCSYWSVVTWGFDSDSGIPSNGLATMVMGARCRLGLLSQWDCQWQKTVDSTTKAIEAAMNFLCTNSDVTLARLSRTFEWELIVERASTSTDEPDSCKAFEVVQLSLSREWLTDGRGWGNWKVDKGKIEAILGLWMLNFKENWQPLAGEGVYRILNIGGGSGRDIYEKWVRRQAQAIAIDSAGRTPDGQTLCLVGMPSTTQSSSGNSFDLLAVKSEALLENICGQVIFSAFISSVAKTALKAIGGKVRVRSTGFGVKTLFGLRNTVLDELADKVHQTGLTTVEDAFLSIIPPLGESEKLPPIAHGRMDVFSDTTKEIMTYIEGGRFEQAEPLFLWLLDAAESSASIYEAKQMWKEACIDYLHLCNAFDDISSGEDYASQAEEAMGLFCERLIVWFKQSHSNEGHAVKDPFDLVRDALGNKAGKEMWKGRLQKWRKNTRKLIPTSDRTGTEALLHASAYGNCLSVAKLLHTSDTDVDTPDSCGRTPLIRASISGHATIVAQLLEKKANPNAQDCHGRTAMHYASMRGHTSVIRVLLHARLNHSIDIEDKDGKSPLNLAMEGNNGAAVALLIFNGAKDPDNDAKRNLEVSLRSGSSAAVKAKMDTREDINSRDNETGRTPLHWSIWRDSREGLKLLLNGGVDLEAKDNIGQTALDYAARKGRAEEVELLLRKGESQSLDNSITIKTMNRQDVVRLLLDRGDNIEAKGNDDKTALGSAASNGYKATVRLLLDHSVDIKAKNNDLSGTALHSAASNGHSETVQLLLDRGADIEAKGNDGVTPLHGAANDGHESTVKLLLDRGADIKAKSNDGTTALHGAANDGHESTVKLLLDRGADIKAKSNDGATALHGAASNGHESTVKLLLDRGADIKAKNNDGVTPLHGAASNGHESTVKLLLDRDPNIKAKGNNGATALHGAASNGYEDVVKLLLDQGADIEAKGNDGATALHDAASSGNEATVKLLLDRNANNIMAMNNVGKVALHVAASNRSTTTVRLLLDYGADIEAKGNDGTTALHDAASNGRETIVQLLLDRGADIDAKGNYLCGTVVHGAASNGHEAIVKLLLDHGANIEAKNNDLGGTALHGAASNGHEATVKLLLDHNADINAKGNCLGETALCGAASNGHEATVQLLLERGADIKAEGHYFNQKALYGAACNGHEATVRLLLDHDADINAKGNYLSGTALRGAACYGHKATVQLLLERGADIEAEGNYFSGTALHCAASNGHEATVRLLLNSGANIEAKNNDFGGTALHGAASNGHEAIVQLLLEHGADREALGDDGLLQ